MHGMFYSCSISKMQPVDFSIGKSSMSSMHSVNFACHRFSADIKLKKIACHWNRTFACSSFLGQSAKCDMCTYKIFLVVG